MELLAPSDAMFLMLFSRRRQARNEQGEGVMEFMFGEKGNVEGSLPTVGLVNPPKFHGDVPEKFL